MEKLTELKDLQKEILKIEETLISNIDIIETLMQKYIDLNSKNKRMGEAFDPFSYFKKRSLLKQINIELGNLDDNIQLFIDMHQGTTLKQIGNTATISNENVKSMASKMVSMAQKYIQIRTKDNSIDRLWQLIQYHLKDQDIFTEKYNKETSEKYHILSVLSEIEIAAQGKDIPKNIFTSRSYPRVPENTSILKS